MQWLPRYRRSFLLLPVYKQKHLIQNNGRQHTRLKCFAPVMPQTSLLAQMRKMCYLLRRLACPLRIPSPRLHLQRWSTNQEAQERKTSLLRRLRTNQQHIKQTLSSPQPLQKPNKIPQAQPCTELDLPSLRKCPRDMR